MVALSRPNPSVLSPSLYAAELRRGATAGAFAPQLEAEYLRARLMGNRALIRVACALGVVLIALRVLEQTVGGSWDAGKLAGVGFVLVTSAALALIAWTGWFERSYLPAARFVVPIRNAVGAVCIARAASQGETELLMVLPLMVLGPFFFLGLTVRAALVSVVAAFASLALATAAFGFQLPLTLRSGVFLLLGTAACAWAARHLERTSRKSFLESRVIAELAQNDALTGLKNRGVFDEYLQRLWQQAVEDDRTIAILLMDIDYFKEYNDAYGHQAGDQALRRVAQTLQSFVSKPADVLARYGGEEFAVILFDVDGPHAQAVADRMRLAVKNLGVEHGGSRAGPVVTISVGVGVVQPSRDRQSRGALQLADQALYEAKVRGRNRIEVLDEAAHHLLETGVFAKSVRVARAG
jgi:diguanylate cyclase (GGDEF)-like protein